MSCCDLKRGTGKCLVLLFTFLFGAGVIVSTLSPNWIAFTVADANGGGTTEVVYGPFYGQYRTCTNNGVCSNWDTKSVDLSDCNTVDSDEEKLCNHLATWRVTGIICLCLVSIGGGLVFAASCCQVVTCGCCGNSLDCISNLLFMAEVVLSIVTWAFTISTLNMIKTGSTVSNTKYQWGFWLFIATGTIVGALSAWMADWAAEDSALRGIWLCITCRRCRKKSNDNDVDEPLSEPLNP